jgi:internalin A
MTYQAALQKIEQAAAQQWEELDLSGMGLTEVPPEIGGLGELKRLILGKSDRKKAAFVGNPLTKLPSELWKLQQLEELFLVDIQISVIPDVIAQLVNLQTLDLRSNQIRVIPDVIVQLVNLQTLALSFNQIKVIPDAIAQLVNLQTLGFTQNQISSIPDSIAQLVNLQMLNLSFNQISTIPESIARLVNLQTLNLSENQISIIPESIGQLVNLQTLYLSSNQINAIPESIAQLINLQTLYLSSNQISTLPESIAQLINLKRLLLEENPITNVPPEIIRKGWGEHRGSDGEPQAIFQYLKATTKRPLNELKVLLVGEGDVGKTSLFKALTGQPFDAEERKTPGINIQPWNITKDSQSIRLNLWDFGGQKVMHNTHQFFLTKRSLYLLVLDNRKNEAQNRIEYWLKLIETYGGDSPVIIVGNCADENPLQIKIRTLQKKYPQIKQALSTSAKKGTGIEELRQAITNQIDQIPHVHDLLPVSWFDLKQQLESMRDHHDFISYEKYQTLCQAADITTTQAQKALIGFLHDLGVVLNYQDPSYTWLNETNVLNPEWVTSGIYDILNNHDLTVKHKGILALPTLATILKQIDRYPENKRPFLMGLMEKFELSFQLDGHKPPRYLISDLLPIDEPDVDTYEDAPLHFQYQYDILPSSIISRFIVRNHSMINKNMRWRSGVVLTQDLRKALVRADEEDNFIAIKVTGDRGSALLSTIRTDFNKIHATIPHLAVREFLVIREIQDNQPTGREVPIDYNYLCDLDRQGITEAPLPNLKGKYNLRSLLEGVESREARLSDLDDRLDRSSKSRRDRPLQTRKKEKPGLLTVSAMMLIVLAVVSGIVVTIAHFVPGLNLILVLPAILLMSVIVILPALKVTGFITEDSFTKGLEGFFKALPILKGKDPEKPTDNDTKKLPAETNSEK